MWGAHQGLRDLEPGRREVPRRQDPSGKRRRQCFLPWNTSPAARGQMEVAGRPSGGFHRLGSACSEQALSRRKPALGLREVGVPLPSGMEAVFLQSRTQPAPVPLESRPTPSRRCWVDGVAGPRPLPPPAPHTVCALGGAATPRGRPSPVPPICELIPQGAWAAAGAADPECGRGCSPRRYKTARRRRICMKLGRGPTQIFLGVEPMKLVCKMQPLVRPATPPSGRMLGPQPEAASVPCWFAPLPPPPPPPPGPGVSQRLRLGLLIWEMGTRVHLSGHRGGRGSHQGKRGAIFPWAARWSARRSRGLGPTEPKRD